MPAASELGDLSSPDVAARGQASVLAVPLGSTEQHGPHLPLSTDTDIAVELCRRLAGARADVLVAPALPYGSSGEHAAFPGTLSIGHDALLLILLELVRSADFFAGVVIVSAHGGNAEAVVRAVDTLTAEGRLVLAWSPRSSDPCDLHAGFSETSALLAIDPGRVDVDRIRAGVSRPLPELLPAMRAGGVAAVSDSGVLGDPTAATAAAGEAILAAWSGDLLREVHKWIG